MTGASSPQEGPEGRDRSRCRHRGGDDPLAPELVEQLGLRRAGKVLVRLANEERVELEKATGIHLAIGDREMSASCLIGPPGCEPLVGQLVMEELDLIADPLLKPESPFLPTLKMKSLAGVRQNRGGAVD